MALPRTLGKQGPEPQAQRALGDSQTAHAAFRRSLLSIPAGRWPSVAGTAQAPGPAPPPPGPEEKQAPQHRAHHSVYTLPTGEEPLYLVASEVTPLGGRQLKRAPSLPPWLRLPHSPAAPRSKLPSACQPAPQTRQSQVKPNQTSRPRPHPAWAGCPVLLAPLPAAPPAFPSRQARRRCGQGPTASLPRRPHASRCLRSHCRARPRRAPGHASALASLSAAGDRGTAGCPAGF